MPLDKEWPLCNECLSQIERLHPPFCSRCGRTLTETECRFCLEGRTPDPVFPIRSSARYAGRPVQAAILLAKTGRFESLMDHFGRVLVPLALPFLDSFPETEIAVVPVPQHARRFSTTGFNFPDRLALRLAREVGLEYRPLLLNKAIDTRPQKGLSLSDRMENVAGSFNIVKSKPLQNQMIFLVDDVTTSGATLAAAATPLIQAGAHVVALTLARA